MIINHLNQFVDHVAACFFCCVVGVFLLPLIVDRIVFFIPTLIHLTSRNEVQARSVRITIYEIALWAMFIIGTYAYLYYFERQSFVNVTVSIGAIIAWIISIIHFIYRFFHFDRMVKRSFYYNAYMRYITPNALNAYQQFIERLDDMTGKQMKSLLKSDISYMHRQAVLRKLRESKERRL